MHVQPDAGKQTQYQVANQMAGVESSTLLYDAFSLTISLFHLVLVESLPQVGLGHRGRGSQLSDHHSCLNERRNNTSFPRPLDLVAVASLALVKSAC